MSGEDVVIVGGGLAGLCCARSLREAGISFLLLDAADRVGGRVRTDIVEGFQLDRGFQALLLAYPEARRVLNYRALHLRPFYPGVLLRSMGRFHRLSDPRRRPLQALRSLHARVATYGDKVHIGQLRRSAHRGSIEELLARPETTTLELLHSYGFSEQVIDRFFRPFVAEVFLDPDMVTSSRLFEFLLRMFSLDVAALPAAGMEAIPRQIAAALPVEAVRVEARVAAVDRSRVSLATGESIPARAVVVATDGVEAARLIEGLPPLTCRSVTCLYFAADESPIDEAIIALDGESGAETAGPVNNLCVLTAVAPSYGPPGAALISATVLRGQEKDDAALEAAVREQLVGWFGAVVRSWRHLRTYRIPDAIPDQRPPALTEERSRVAVRPGLYVCGDHRDTASINGAMASGRRAAEAVIRELRGG